MSSPPIQALTVRGFVQDFSIFFKNMNYIADRVAMIKDNVSKVAKVTKYRPGDWFRDEADVRAPGTRAKRGSHVLDEVNVNPLQFAFAKEVTDEDVAAEGDQLTPTINLQRDAVEFTADKIDLKKEKRVSQLIKDTTWADGNAAGEDVAGLWAPGGANTFLADIRNGKATVRNKTGVIPNVLIIDYTTFESLIEEDTINNKINQTRLGVLTEELLAAIIGVDEVLVAKAIENTANEVSGADAFTSQNVWETNQDKGAAFLFFRPVRMGLKTPAAIGQFRVKMPNGQGRRTMVWREEAEHQWVYETAEDTDIVALHANLGYQFIDTFAS